MPIFVIADVVRGMVLLSCLTDSIVSTIRGAMRKNPPAATVAPPPSTPSAEAPTFTGVGRASAASLALYNPSASRFRPSTPRPPPEGSTMGEASSEDRSRQPASTLSRAPRNVCLTFSEAPSNLFFIPSARASRASSAPSVPSVTDWRISSPVLPIDSPMMVAASTPREPNSLNVSAVILPCDLTFDITVASSSKS